MTVRDDLHQLIDVLPEDDLAAIRRYVEYLRSGATDAMLWALDNAPEDDEPSTPEEDREAAEAWQEYLREGGISAEEAKRLLLS
jgi:hypothetical protein